MRVQPSQIYIAQPKNSKNTGKSAQNIAQTSPAANFELRSKFNDHLMSFGARVDKGLERFYDTNKERMPSTLRRYVESMEDKSRLTPLEAQKRAFSKLESAQTVGDIKKSFPDEELFKNLINPLDSKAKRGILMSAKENDELLSLSNQGVLKSRENLTVYLVKKVFLEAKTIEEINKDLENDLDPDFKADFRFKNPDSPYVYGSTLRSVGIELPEFEYQQSLRYTKAGYADLVGEKISQGQRAFWDSLDDSERTARAKVSVEKFENWWYSHTKNEMLDMIADDVNELEMLKSFKKSRRAEEKQNKNTETAKTPEESPRKHTKAGSQKLSQDELFKKWATNKLKLFEANLSEAERDTLHIKRMQRLSARWAGMTSAQRTDYISKMKSGSEPLRYTMIDAWNHSADLIKELSAFLKANQVFKPADLLYSTQEFSSFQSRVMNEFWEKHPDFASDLGKKIVLSQEKIQRAISSGTFEELKKQIMRDKNQRVKEIEKFKNNLPSTPKIEINPEKPQYQKDFADAYNKHVYGKVKSMPKNFYSDMYETVFELLPEEAIRAWTKNLRGEALNLRETEIVKKFVSKELSEIARYNRALEAALADTLYEFTKNPDVYTMSNSDVKMAMYHLERKEEPIVLDSHKNGRRYVLNIVKKNKPVNAERINSLYEFFKKDLSDSELDKVVDDYYPALSKAAFERTLKSLNIMEAVNVTNGTKEALKNYMNQYGASLFVLFSEKSAYPPAVKAAFYEKFKANMPEDLKSQLPECIFDSPDQFEMDNKLKHIAFKIAQKYDFVPAAFMKDYSGELTAKLRNSKDFAEIDNYEARYLTKRKSPNDRGKIILIGKVDFSMSNKLKTLAMEQALADVLYEATGNKDVFGMQFEELCDNIEVFRLVKDKNIPSEDRTYHSFSLDKDIAISLKKKPNLNALSRLYKEYFDEMVIWVNEDVKKEGKGYFVDLLGILNPDETDKAKDDAVALRIRKYGMNLAE